VIYDTERWAQRRRVFDRLEAKAVRLLLAASTNDALPVVQAIRYALSFARLTQIRNVAGVDVDVSGPLHLFARDIEQTLGQKLNEADNIWSVVGDMPRVLTLTRQARESLLSHLPIDRESLEEEVTTRKLVVVSGGGGGAGYVYPGCYEVLERNGLIPDLMVGTSIGSLMSLFRARRRLFDPAPMVAAAKQLWWSRVFRVLETQNRYGLPATLRLYLHAALGRLFLNSDGEPLSLSEMEIPLYIIAAGFTVDALKHDLGYYEHLLDGELSTGVRGGVRTGVKVLGLLREFFSTRESLREVVLGRAEGTEDFDVLDASGFSSAIPGVIHYDVLRDDPRMKRILDDLYARHGITRLGDGGIVANVPARVGWETVVSGKFGRRNAFVLALDCFAPNPRKLPWYPVQQAARSANVDADREFADLYMSFPRTLSPVNLVPPVRDALLAIRWGREALEPEVPFLKMMVSPIPVLGD
jgi:hypothetical protein